MALVKGLEDRGLRGEAEAAAAAVVEVVFRVVEVVVRVVEEVRVPADESVDLAAIRLAATRLAAALGSPAFFSPVEAVSAGFLDQAAADGTAAALLKPVVLLT